MIVTLFSQENENIQEASVSTFQELVDMTEIYFGKNKQLMKNDKQVKSINDLTDGDFIVVQNNFVNEDDLNSALSQIMANDDSQEESEDTYTDSLIFIKGECNGMTFKIMIDSGAQTNVMSESLVNTLNVNHFVDKRYCGMAKGVGTAPITGRIHDFNIRLENEVGTTIISCPFSIMRFNSGDNAPEMILGLNFLYKYGCVLDLNNRYLFMRNDKIKLLNEIEIEKYEYPIDNQKEIIKNSYKNLINKNSDSMKIKESIERIITNIINSPNDEKYKSINLESDAFTKTFNIDNSNVIDFFSNIGFRKIDNRLRFIDTVDVLLKTREIICR